MTKLTTQQRETLRAELAKFANALTRQGVPRRGNYADGYRAGIAKLSPDARYFVSGKGNVYKHGYNAGYNLRPYRTTDCERDREKHRAATKAAYWRKRAAGWVRPSKKRPMLSVGSVAAMRESALDSGFGHQ